MPTVVDSLIVTLGLDPAGFNAGQKAAAQAWLKTKDEAKSSGKAIEESAKKSGEFLQQLQGRVLMLAAAFMGGKGIKQFTADLVQNDAALGRMAVIVGTTTQTLSRWQGIANATGGSAAGVTGGINSLNQSLVNLSLTGESSVIPYLRALQAFAPAVNLSLMGANGQMRTAVDMLPDLHKAVQGMDAARSTAILSGMGLGQDLINILIQSDEVFNKFMQDQQRWGTVTKEQAAAAQELQYNTAGVTQSFTTLGRMILQSLSPAFNNLLKKLQDVFVWFQANPEKLKLAFAGVTAAVVALGLAFGGPIAWVAALAVAGALLYDDWRTWNEGGKSQFGEFWQYVTDKWNAIRDTATKVWDDIGGSVMPILSGLKQLMVDTFNIWAAGWRLAYALFFGTAEDVKSAWSNLVGAIGTQWVNFWDGLAKAIYNATPAIYDAIKQAFSAGFDWVMERANVIWRAITGGNLFEKDSTGGWGQKTDTDGPGASAAAGGGAIKAPADRKQIDEDIAAYQALGWTREQATGIVANTVAESTGDKNAVGDGGKAYGLHQWHPDRQANFKQVFGHDIRESTRDEQRRFTDWELRNSERAAGEALKRTGSPGEAARVLSTLYERPKYAGLEAVKRSALAAELYRPPGSQPQATVPTGAPAAAAVSAAALPPFQIPGTSSSETNIGTIVVNTQATDAQGIADDIKPALERNTFAANSNYGQI